MVRLRKSWIASAEKNFAQRLAEKLLRAPAEMGFDVGRCPRNHPVGGECDQEADGLDGAQDMDGLAVAIRKIDALNRLVHPKLQNLPWVRDRFVPAPS